MKVSTLLATLLVAVSASTAMAAGVSSGVWQSETPYYGDSSQQLQGALASDLQTVGSSVWQSTVPYYGAPEQMAQGAETATILGAGPSTGVSVWQRTVPYYGDPSQQMQGAVPGSAASFAYRMQ